MLPVEVIWGVITLYLLHAVISKLCQKAIDQDRLPTALRYSQLKLLLWPLDRDNWVELGNLYGDLQQWRKAQAIFLNVLRFKKHHGALLGAGTAQLALAQSPQESQQAHLFFSQINPVDCPSENTDFSPISVKHLPKGSETEFQKQGWMVIDNFFELSTLRALHSYCQKPEIWQHHYNGYEGAHLDDGLSHPQLYQLAAHLSKTWPMVFKNHRLMYAWAFRYAKNHQGVALHHDSSHINVNLWLTPDKHNLSPNKGGITLYPHNPPKSWDLERYTLSSLQMQTFLKNKKVTPVHIPYQYGRMVIFNSRFLHTSQDFVFENQLHQRRLNLTLLFGKHPLRYFPRQTLPEEIFNQKAARSHNQLL